MASRLDLLSMLSSAPRLLVVGGVVVGVVTGLLPVGLILAGRLVEYGTHDELLALGGQYAQMYRIQAQGYQ